MKRKKSFVAGVLLPHSLNSEEGLGVKGGNKFYSCQSKEPTSIHNGNIFHVFLYGKTATVLNFFASVGNILMSSSTR